MTETELLAHCLEAAAELGLLAFHSADSRLDDGDPGFPDLVLVGAELELWELKSATGYPDWNQETWQRRLSSAGVAWRLIRPDMWPDEIYARMRTIRGR